MINNPVARLLLFPFSLIYAFIMGIRNALYEAEVLKSSAFSIPIISVGNLSVGGAGKTPHIEYLIQLLRPYLNVAILSRGYNRKTKGFRFVTSTDNVSDTGDEPLMYSRKYKDIVVAVCENRALAIPQIVGKHPAVQAVLLDDAFQHRSVKPGLNILLTPYDNPFYEDFVMPAGRLREPRASYRRADIIIITKCPDNLTSEEIDHVIDQLSPAKNQKVFFSKYKYHHPYNFFHYTNRVALSTSSHVLLITAIANTEYMKKFLENSVDSITPLEYEDHHNFTDFDISYMIKMYNGLDLPNKIILTTEKDAMRLSIHYQKLKEAGLPIYVIPVEVVFNSDAEEESFTEIIKDYLYHFQS